MICNTSGWDTDCNSGNLGCLLGIRNGLEGFEGAQLNGAPVDWRGPVADRIYLPTMDGGRCVTDAAAETFRIVNMARALNGESKVAPKDTASPSGECRFNFELPGSVQGFRVDQTEPCAAQVELTNVEGHSRKGRRSLAIAYRCPEGETAARVSTPTFILPEDLNMPGYSLIASPTLYPGQTLRVGAMAAEGNAQPVEARLLLRFYDSQDRPQRLSGPEVTLAPGTYQEWSWTVPELKGMPIFAVGLEIGRPEAHPGEGLIYLDYLTWDGIPKTVFTRPEVEPSEPSGPQLWRSAWVSAVDQWEKWWRNPFRLVQNEGRGLVTTGMREWTDYRISSPVRPAMMKAGGLAARVQGLRRFYALQLTNTKKLQLLRVYEDSGTVLAEVPFDWQLWEAYDLVLEVKGSRLRGWAAGQKLIDYDDAGTPLTEGAIGLVLEEGHLMTDWVAVEPVE
jgi:hypothetical protein